MVRCKYLLHVYIVYIILYYSVYVCGTCYVFEQKFRSYSRYGHTRFQRHRRDSRISQGSNIILLRWKKSINQTRHVGTHKRALFFPPYALPLQWSFAVRGNKQASDTIINIIVIMITIVEHVNGNRLASSFPDR